MQTDEQIQERVKEIANMLDRFITLHNLDEKFANPNISLPPFRITNLNPKPMFGIYLWSLAYESGVEGKSTSMMCIEYIPKPLGVVEKVSNK